MDHHIIPQVYLRQFVDFNKKIHSIKTRVLYKQKVGSFTTAQIAYEPDYYNLSKALTTSARTFEPNHIESRVNTLHESGYEKFIKIFEKKPRSILMKEAAAFVEVLISFKQRNPIFKLHLENENFQELFNKRIDQLIDNGAFIDSVLKQNKYRESKEVFIARLREQANRIATSNHIAHDFQLESMIRFAQGTEEVTREVSDLLLYGEWTLFESAKVPFITSDNPGYTLDERERVHNLNFGDAKAYQFPLSPKLLLLIMLPVGSVPITVNKEIGHAQSDSELTRLLNRASVPYSYKRIFSNDKNEMQYMLDNYSNHNVK